MTIRTKILITILLCVCLFCLSAATIVFAEQTDVIQTKLTLSGFSSGATRAHNGGVDYVPITNKGFYATMPLNDVYVDGEENWTGGVRFKPESGAAKVNGVATNGIKLLKYGATSYYVDGFSLSAGSSLIFDGVFYNDANGNGRRDVGEIALNIQATEIVYDGDKYVQHDVADGATKPYSSFTMAKGAALRLNVGFGLKFAATISADDYNLLVGNGATFGFAFVHADDITATITAERLFGANAEFSVDGQAGKKPMVVVDSTIASYDGGYRMEGCLRNIAAQDIYTEFVAVAFAHTGSEYVIADFWAGNIANNTRSCYYAAQLAVDENDNVDAVTKQYIDVAAPETETITVKSVLLGNGMTETVESVSQAVVNSVRTVTAPHKDGYELTSESTVSCKIYANRPQTVTFVYESRSSRNIELSAFAPPKLDSRNNYDNATNKKIIADMKAAGLNTFVLSTIGNVTTQDDVDKIKTIADMLWRYDIQTVVDFKKLYYALDEYPDFSDCEGVSGVFHYDEPTYMQIDSVLCDFVEQFNSTYGNNPAVRFEANLFPYEAQAYGALGNDKYGNSVTYRQYVEHYCQAVANKVNGDKYLSVDTYPIRKDGKIDNNFLASLAWLRYYADKYDCFANVCLQSSGFNEGSDTKERMPTEEEMRMQAYAATAFGMDGISWFTYGSVSSIGQTASNTPVDFETAAKGNGYDSLAVVNAELFSFADVYKSYDWQGVMFLQQSYYASSLQSIVGSVFDEKIVNVSQTHFSAINADSSVICGTFNGQNSSNKALAFVNYNAPTTNKSATITLFSSESVDVTLYKNGKAVKANVNGSYSIVLAPGEGCFVVTTRQQQPLTAGEIAQGSICSDIMAKRVRTITAISEKINDYFFDSSLTDGKRQTLFEDIAIFDANDFDGNYFVTLPAFDFLSAGRTEFGVRLDTIGTVSDVQICGVGADDIVSMKNLLFVVQKDGNAAVLTISDIKTLTKVIQITLPQKVSAGFEGMRFDFYCKDYTYLQISEFHSVR